MPGRPALRDIGLALAVFAYGVIEAWRGLPDVGFGPRAFDARMLLGVTLCSLPLAWRRSAPLVAPAGVLVAVLADHASGGIWTSWSAPDALNLAILIALFSVAAHARLPIAVLGGAMAGVADALATHWCLCQSTTSSLYDAAIMAFVWLVGRIRHGAGARNRQLDAQSERLEGERLLAAELAVASERARIARDVHDAVAHAVAMMIVQAAA